MRVLFAILALLWLGGCASNRSHYQINVGNGRPGAAVRDVRVQADGKDLPEFKVIAANKLAATKPRKGALPEAVSVSWVDPEGNRVTESVPLAEEVRPGFTGQLVLEITPENTLTLTAVESGGQELSTMPWAMPEAWEGSVNMPGFEE